MELIQKIKDNNLDDLDSQYEYGNNDISSIENAAYR